ncbi:Gp35 [Mycolicibacterium canariasense]|uniref:Gp35 n=1 Tax=Mycolicibacterium canariasense TaxID=228230 RepID=A0A117I983_MYCCR|nr:helix-turn-helix domain-containing protein [Mycolicibacterium canariasense]MCV7208841.1 helix-turn-helix domain-containing protein [Mycolicibacterium canariasense]ORV07096.1 hypothetical protein AWB94_13925 [Mycolicibacterium canariasense]GAS94370.1 Gp35 [Mycolicibacterium canariasense]
MPEVTYMTTSQVADKFGVLPSTVRKWVAENKLKPAVATPGGHYRFHPDDIDALLTGKASA